VTFDNPPINVMGPQTVREFQELIDAIEADEQLRVVVFDSAVEGYFLNHSDFTARLEDLTSMPPGPTGLPPWPDFLVRLTRAPVASIALIRGRATGNGSENRAVLRHDLRKPRKGYPFAMGSRWLVMGSPGRYRWRRLPLQVGRNRAMEILLGSEDIPRRAGPRPMAT